MDVPNFRDDNLRVSPLVLGLRDEVVDTAIGLDRIRELLPFQPTTTRAFSAEDVVRIFARATWKGSAAGLDTKISVEGASAASPLEFTVSGQTSAEGWTATIDRTIPLRGLAPGNYVLRLITRSAAGDSVIRQVPFVIR